MNVDTVAMAEDLELKMNNLINGYEQLDMISSKVSDLHHPTSDVDFIA